MASIFDDINSFSDLLDLQNFSESNDDEPTNSITGSKLTHAWERGIVADKAYVFFIIYMFTSEQDLLNINVEDICVCWSGIGKDGNKAKELKPDVVNKALLDIYYAGLIDIKNIPHILKIEKTDE